MSAWENARAETAREAGRARPWAQAVFIVSLALVIGQAGLGMIGRLSARAARDGEKVGLPESLTEFALQVVTMAPAIALVAAVYHAWRYLERLEGGEVWAASTAGMLGEIGSCLIASSVFAVVLTPSILIWSEGRIGAQFDLEATPLVLGGLGVALTMIGQAFARVARAAAALKAENDQFV